MRLELSRGSSNAAPTAQSPRGRISTPSRVSGGPPGWTLALRRFQSTRWLSSAVKSDEFPCPAISLKFSLDCSAGGAGVLLHPNRTEAMGG